MSGLIAEYLRHKGTIIMYPYRGDIWRDSARHIQNYICNLADIISRFEDVYLFCIPDCFSELRARFINNAHVFVISSEYYDAWARDIAPSFIKDKNQVVCMDWMFNAWGGMKEGSYHPWDKDDEFASFVAKYLGLNCKRASIVVEGGGIITDGVGTVFTTQSVLLNHNRNPFLKKEYVEEQLRIACCASRVVWLRQGLALDETNGHIDNVLSFISPKDLCLAWTDDRNNPNYLRVREIEKVLESLFNLNGDRYTIHRIPLPPLQYMTENESRGIRKGQSLARNAGDLLPASYINFYMLNGAVLIPFYGYDTDIVAFNRFKSIFYDREIIPIYSREPLLGGGGIHCLLHEIPILEI